MKTNLIKVSRTKQGLPELFASLQGEGPTVGLPSTFLRLAHCNLTCIWCDTAYTWDWSRFDPTELTLDVDAHDLVAAIRSLEPRNLVVTGGEPLLQQPALESVATSLKADAFTIEVETNGTIAPAPSFMAFVDRWNVSPKLGGSGNRRSRAVVRATLQLFRDLPNATFKFVISIPKDLDDFEQLQDEMKIPTEQIVLMPQGTSVRQIRTVSRWLVPYCVGHNYRYGSRLHVTLWGDKRGH